MSRIKGRYVATVTIDTDVEREKGMLPFETIKKNWDGLALELKSVIQGLQPGMLTIEVNTQYSDIYEVSE